MVPELILRDKNPKITNLQNKVCKRETVVPTLRPQCLFLLKVPWNERVPAKRRRDPHLPLIPQSVTAAVSS